MKVKTDCYDEKLELETDEDTAVLGKGYKAIGFTFTCPRCSKKNSFYSAKWSAWVCFECGLVFSSDLAYMMQDLVDNDKEEQQCQE